MKWYGIVTTPVTTITNNDATVSDTDGLTVWLFSTGNTNRTLTLPTAADNKGRVIVVKKIDSGTGQVIVDGEGSENIDGSANVKLFLIYESVTVVCNGSDWYIDSYKENNLWRAYTPSTQGFGTISSLVALWRRMGSNMDLLVRCRTGTTTAVEARVGLPSGYSLDAAVVSTGFEVGRYMRDTTGVNTIKDGIITTNTGGSPGITYVNFGYGNYVSTVSPFTLQNGNDVFGNSEIFALICSVPIAEFS